MLRKQVEQGRPLLPLVLLPLQSQDREAPEEEKTLSVVHPAAIQENITEAGSLERNHEEKEDDGDPGADEKTFTETHIGVITLHPARPLGSSIGFGRGLILKLGDFQTSGTGRALDLLAGVFRGDIKVGLAVWAGD